MGVMNADPQFVKEVNADWRERRGQWEVTVTVESTVEGSMGFGFQLTGAQARELGITLIECAHAIRQQVEAR